MAKPCSVCTHADVQTINAKLAQNRSYREITGRFQLSKSALGRHATACVADLLDAAREADAVENGVITEESVKEAWGKIRKQIDLADEWLTDPNDPTKYTLNPRADNVQVVYYDLTDKNEQGKPKRKHADLQELLYRLDKEGYDIDRVKLPKVAKSPVAASLS